MSGIRLEATANIVTCSIGALKNIVKVVERSGVKVSDVILQPLASSYSTLIEDEKQVGVVDNRIVGAAKDIYEKAEKKLRISSDPEPKKKAA